MSGTLQFCALAGRNLAYESAKSPRYILSSSCLSNTPRGARYEMRRRNVNDSTKNHYNRSLCWHANTFVCALLSRILGKRARSLENLYGSEEVINSDLCCGWVIKKKSLNNVFFSCHALLLHDICLFRIFEIGFFFYSDGENGRERRREKAKEKERKRKCMCEGERREH